MIGLFCRLKLAILFSSFRGEAKRRFGASIAGVMAVGGGIAAGLSFFFNTRAGGAAAGRTLIVGFSLVFVAWVFGPLLLGGVDDSLDPRFLTTLPLDRRTLRNGLIVSALIGYLPWATMLALSGAIAGSLAGSTRAGPATVLLFVAPVALLMLALAAARLLSIGLARAARTRRGRDIAIVLASLAGSVLWLLIQSARRVGTRQLQQAARVLRWGPAGSLGDAMARAQRGEMVLPLISVGIVCALTVALLVAWTFSLERLVTQPESIAALRGNKHKEGHVALIRRRGDDRPVARWRASLAKELRYLSRSPQKRSALVVASVIGTVFAIFQVVRDGHPKPDAVFTAPIALLFGLGVTNNLLGADGPSMWIELTAGAKIRELLLGRGIAAIPNIVVPVLSAATGLALLSGGWSQWVLVCALALVGWGIPLGVGCLVSVLAPFPQPDTANPFSNRRVAPGEGCLIGIIGIVGLLAVGLLLSPISVAWLAWHEGGGPEQLKLVVATAGWSMLIWQLGLFLATRYARTREVDLLEELGAHQVNT